MATETNRTILGVLKATEIPEATKTQLYSRPVVIDGVMQHTLHRLLSPLDVRINGISLRLPADCVVSLIAGGSGGQHGSLGCDVEFVGLDGQTYTAQKGMGLTIPAPADA